MKPATSWRDKDAIITGNDGSGAARVCPADGNLLFPLELNGEWFAACAVCHGHYVPNPHMYHRGVLYRWPSTEAEAEFIRNLPKEWKKS